MSDLFLSPGGNPSNILSDETYFTSYEDPEIHRLMIKDTPRTKAYHNAIFSNLHLFKGKIAMDIGAGTGILSLFMAKAGARKVYAVEASKMALLIPDIAKDNGFEDVIEVFHAKVEDIKLPSDEKVDIIISEWMGFYLLHESMLGSVIFARDTFLSDEGFIFPSDAKLYACPCSLDNMYKTSFNFWNDVYGFNMSTIRNYELKLKTTKPEICSVKPSDLLTEPVCIKTFNLRSISIEDIESFFTKNFMGVSRDGNYDGLCLWFDCVFDGVDYDLVEDKEIGNISTFSTSPYSPDTHWKQTVIVFGTGRANTSVKEEKSIKENNCKKLKSKLTDVEKDSFVASCENDENFIEENEVVGWRLEFRRNAEISRHYSITMELLDPQNEEHPVPCICPMPKCVVVQKFLEKEEELLE